MLTVGCVPGTSDCYAGGGSAVSTAALFFHTTDGKAWKASALPASAKSVTRIAAPDATHVYLVANGMVLVGP